MEKAYFKSNLVCLVERVLTDKLDDLSEVLLELKNANNLFAKSDEVRVSLLVVGLQSTKVLGIRVKPVQGGEMLALGELLVETPEDLDDAEGGRCNGLREITSRRRDSTDNGHRTLARRVTKATDFTSALVERGKTGSLGDIYEQLRRGRK